MIRFEKVRYKNFLSTGNNFTEINLGKDKHTLIVGDNGSGKSTMLDAISFALFGKPHRGINKPQLINSINNKDMLVEIEFREGNSKYKVVRGIKPVVFEIYVNDTMINQNSHAKEYQKILEQNILKLSHKTFHQVVVLGSSSFTPFMQLGAWQRREVIEDLLDINVFSKMNHLLKERSATLKEKINQAYHSIEINETKTEAQKKYLRDLSAISSQQKKEKLDNIKHLQENIRNLNNSNESLTNAITTYEVLGDQVDKNTEELNKLNEFAAQFKVQQKEIVKQAKFYENTDLCPTCDQTIDEKLKEYHLNTCKTKARTIATALEMHDSRKTILDAQMDELNVKLDEIREWQSTIRANVQEIGTLNRNIDGLNSDITRIDNESGDLAKANDEYDALMKEYHALMETRNKLNDQHSYNAVISEMLKDTGIKTKIIKQYLPVINKLVNQYLTILDFYVHFDLDGSFNETIRSRHRDSFTYDSFSEGEKQRIDLALLFTWRQVAKMKNSISTNLLVLDETFDSSLDEAGIENLLKIIHTLGDDTSVFVISHKGEMLDGKFDSKIEFIKDKNFSKIKNNSE